MGLLSQVLKEERDRNTEITDQIDDRHINIVNMNVNIKVLCMCVCRDKQIAVLSVCSTQLAAVTQHSPSQIITDVGARAHTKTYCQHDTVPLPFLIFLYKLYWEFLLYEFPLVGKKIQSQDYQNIMKTISDARRNTSIQQVYYQVNSIHFLWLRPQT